MDICYPKHLSDSEPLKDIYSRSRQNSIQNTVNSQTRPPRRRRQGQATQEAKQDNGVLGQSSASPYKTAAREALDNTSPVLLVEPYSPILLDLLPTPYPSLYKTSLFTSPSLIYTFATIFLCFFSSTSYHYYLPTSTFRKGAIVRETAAYKTWAGKQPTQVVYSQQHQKTDITTFYSLTTCPTRSV